MKKLLILVVLFAQVTAGPPEWDFEDAYDDHMLYLHALINYRFDLRWYDRWEANLLAGNGFLLSVGSVTVDDLLIDGHLVLNNDLGGGWRFQADGRWLETRHLNSRTRDAFMGLEKLLTDDFGVFLNVTPFYDKEFTDIRTGFTFYNTGKQNYIRLGLKIDDFVYDDKNEFGAVTEQAPLGVEWHARYQSDYWTVYTSGLLGTGFKRSFPDRSRSPDLLYHAHRVNRGAVKLYLDPADRWNFGTGLHHYSFYDSKVFTAGDASYTYENRVTDFFLEAVYELGSKHRMRSLTHLVWQTASSRGYRAHNFDRSDLMTGLFYLLQLGRHTIETGYMLTIVESIYTNLHGGADRTDKRYLDKLKLGWYYQFPHNAELNISISHQVSIGGFGGANLQYVMIF